MVLGQQGAPDMIGQLKGVNGLLIRLWGAQRSTLFIIHECKNGECLTCWLQHYKILYILQLMIEYI